MTWHVYLVKIITNPKKMIKLINLLGILSILLVASCDNKKQEKDTYQAPVQPAPVEQPAATAPKPKDGTTIKVGEQGVSYENKNGGSKQKVNVSKDSSSVEISNPK